MAAAGASPSSSPRLPSPPPFTEVQIGPKSPSVGESFGKDAEGLLGNSNVDEDVSTRRIRPGTKADDMAFGPPLIPLSQLDSPFQLQEHLKALYHHYTRPEGSDTVVPINRNVAIQLAEPPEGVDRSLWLYELCRFLTMKVNNLIIAFFAESPPCTSQTCPEMRASEWQYLCAVHDPPKSCCAIDYCCHTLDWATNILTSPKYFPSRLTLGSEAGGGPQASMRHLTNIFRRLYRIFAHAWFQHREVFWQVEGHDGLYIFFKTVCDMYNLIPEDNYTVPAEAEGLDAQPPVQEPVDGRRLTILRKEDENPFPTSLQDLDASSLGTAATTRRHKHTPSTGSRVTTISESAEDIEQFPLLPEETTVIENPEPQAPAEAAEEQPKAQEQEHEQPAAEAVEPNITVEEVGETAPQGLEPEKPETKEPEQAPEPEKSGEAEQTEEPAKPAETNAEPEPAKQESEAEAAPSTEDTPAQNSEPEPEAESKPKSDKEPEKEAEPESEQKPEAEAEAEAPAAAPAEPASEPKQEAEHKEEKEPTKES
ncbi:hypothetical protein MW887_000485 [Aspergillus wentii]|nr:hypothetical protein MW887_000485 [Aspergillus wentii]